MESYRPQAMANVKLFRVTEFAESVFQSPVAHRTALHPMLVMVLVALWLAIAGHWPLWQMLLRARPGAASPAWLAGLAMHQVVAAMGLLALVAWRRTFKWGIVLLLFWTALGACAMLLRPGFGPAQAASPSALLQFLATPGGLQRLTALPCLLTLLTVALLPAILVVRSRIRRIPRGWSLLMNAIIFAAAYAVLTKETPLPGTTMGSPLDVMALLKT
jgi:glucan phosphoethanolaminetransferase (alkaline phosphatase superfamily)